MDLKKRIKKLSSLNTASTLSADDKRKIFKNNGSKKNLRHTSFESSFNIPPVFPKSCSLFDSHYHGGAYADSEMDNKILLAIKLRKSTNESFVSNSDNEQISPSGSICSTNSGTTNDSAFEVENHKCDLNDTYNFLVNDKRKNSDSKIDVKKDSMPFYKGKNFSSEKLGLRIGRRNTDSQIHIIPSLSDYNPREWGMKPLKKKSTFKKSFERLRALSIGAAEKKKYKTDEKRNTPIFGGNSLVNREWEIVTVGEMCRRLSIEDSLQDLEMPLPEGSTSSQILDDFMIRQIADILPPRAEGYPWISVYSSEKHGFSLSTFYRKMAEFGEEMSPILIIIRDTRGHVFGAVVSTPVYPCEHYYGTGDSCLLFRFTGEYPHTRELRHFTWTGDNQFFINATKDFLSVGAGQGHYGLWLDADLNNGISQKCQTFDNELLAGGEQEEFVVQFIEAFGFSM
ncbi:TLDc domain-containing protein [Strongyloides ratti]|uniref:Oxidation resistance protein 1 n=1 Tax=Strongyloides ratti TaxID=34506 RepID=A0A090L3G6_STRRB|nr:TLDc domain-containing protein [Strongyloides ratti]CEF64232.1 TLDc domain-containing protein [Strongyloides ratti]